MNFDFNDEQRAIKDAARDLLASRYPLAEVRRLATEEERGFTDGQWDEFVSLGWPGLVVDETHGGQGLGIVELVIVQEELGYALAPTPLFSSAAAGLVLQAGGSDEQKERWLAPLAAGELRGTLAMLRDDGPAQADGDTLTGAWAAVPDAGSADVLILNDGERHWAVAADADGVTVESTPGIDPTRKLFRVSVDGAAADPLPGDQEIMRPAHDAAATAIAAESVGVAQRAMEMAVEYAKDRKQFDTPIGAFQAVSHRCAEMLLETEGARSATYHAAWALDHEPASGALATSMAKAYASDAGFRVPAASIQVHGGIGFTWEHDLHWFFKRGTANAHAFGDARWHRARVADLAGI
ncbi:MAG TPA: acyl-CoA dehydrogenase family protein [Solirubrobacteraceae bacterium]|nr:acyl-CoA dehydrogenase family protein [Solirubrobacteraceae bacterium]